MGLGSTARKIQGISDKAEELYTQVQDLQNRIVGLEEEVDDTHETVKRIDRQVQEQRALLVAIADELDIQPERVLAEAALEGSEEPEQADT